MTKRKPYQFIVEINPTALFGEKNRGHIESRSSVKANLEETLRGFFGDDAKVTHLNARSAQKIAREWS